MIKISIKNNNNVIEEVSITGHAMYDDFGKDIVCSSVSSIVITRDGMNLRCAEKVIEKADISPDKINISLLSLSTKILLNITYYKELTNLLLENMISLLEELGLQYPENIKFL